MSTAAPGFDPQVAIVSMSYRILAPGTVDTAE
jgi:hypothetical protein